MTSASAPQAPIADEYVGKQERLITSQELRPFTRISHPRAVLSIVFEYGLITGAAWFCASHWSLLLYAATVVLIGARQHALGVIAHDAAHYTLFKNRWANDWIGETVLGWPILISLRFYRRQHLAHHANLSSERDPDYVRNRPDLLVEQRTWRDVLLLMAGRGTKQAGLSSMFVGAVTKPGDRAWIVGRLFYYLAGAALITWMGWWPAFALYWLVPLFTWFVLVMRLRTILEHWGVENRTTFDMTRTTLVGPLEGLLLLPNHISLHLEHHHYPRVPCYRLPALRRRLLENPVFRERAHVSRGVFRALLEVFRYPARHRAEAV